MRGATWLLRKKGNSCKVQQAKHSPIMVWGTGAHLRAAGVGQGGLALLKLMEFSLLKPIRDNFGLEIRLQIISQVDCNVCFKNI